MFAHQTHFEQLGNHLGESESGWKERLTWNDGYLESSVWRGSFDDCGRAQNKWLFNGNPRALDSACLDPQWQSAFHGQSRAGKCERTKQMTFQWQSRASQTHTGRLRWTALHKSTLHSNTFGSVSAVHWQCIGHFSREWLRLTGGHLVHRENWTAMITAHIWPPKGKRQLCFSPSFPPLIRGHP